MLFFFFSFLQGPNICPQKSGVIILRKSFFFFPENIFFSFVWLWTTFSDSPFFSAKLYFCIFSRKILFFNCVELIFFPLLQTIHFLNLTIFGQKIKKLLSALILQPPRFVDLSLWPCRTILLSTFFPVIWIYFRFGNTYSFCLNRLRPLRLHLKNRNLTEK